MGEQGLGARWRSCWLCLLFFLLQRKVELSLWFGASKMAGTSLAIILKVAKGKQFNDKC